MNIAIVILLSLILVIQIIRWVGDYSRNWRLSNLYAAVTRIEQAVADVQSNLDWVDKHLHQIMGDAPIMKKQN